MRRYFQSLWFRLIFGLLLGSLAAVLAASLFLYIRFKNVDVESRERTLQGQARLIAEHYKKSPGHFELPYSIAPFYRDGAGEFVILDKDGNLLAASDGVTRALHPVDPDANREFFVRPQPEDKPSYYGLSLKIRSSPSVWVQVVFKDNEVIFDSDLEEFIQDIAWIWLPFVAILLIINLFVIRIG